MTLKELKKKRKSLVHQTIFARRMGWYKETLIQAENEEIGMTPEDLQRYEIVLNEIENEMKIESEIKQEQQRKEVSAVV